MDAGIYVAIFIIIFLFGIVIGSFTNVLIYRLPEHQDIVKVNSHCMSCGHKLQWYDLVPLFSWLFLKGHCRYCSAKISKQYPLIEFINGSGYVLIFLMNFLFSGFEFTGTGFVTSACYSLAFSMLVALSVIDWRTNEIPFGLNVTIWVLGLINLVFLFVNSHFDYHVLLEYLIGMVCVSGLLLLIYIITGGRGIGGGDIKLMFAAGLLLGWKSIILAFVIGCVVGSIIHLILMKVSHKGRVLAFGPYLSFGIFIAMLFGSKLIELYMGIMF